MRACPDFHVKEKREARVLGTTGSHAIITHGDDSCLFAFGGVDCTIRRMVPGYATLVRMPVYISNDVRDVRAAGSDGLSWYQVLAVRGAPHDGTFKAFTEIRLESGARRLRLWRL